MMPNLPMEVPETVVVPPAVEATRWIAVGSALALIVLLLAWHLWLPARPNLSAVLALPLAVPLAGLLKRRMYTYRWTSLLVWLYVLDAGVRLAEGALPVLELVLALTLFLACGLHVRLRLRHARHERSDLPAA
jgi:uncharacterized membrane protein